MIIKFCDDLWDCSFCLCSVDNNAAIQLGCSLCCQPSNSESSIKITECIQLTALLRCYSSTSQPGQPATANEQRTSMIRTEKDRPTDRKRDREGEREESMWMNKSDVQCAYTYIRGCRGNEGGEVTVVGSIGGLKGIKARNEAG